MSGPTRSLCGATTNAVVCTRRLHSRAFCSSSDAVAWVRHRPRSADTVKGAPLLLVHGFACGRNDWGSLPRALASRSCREVLTLDNRGVGSLARHAGPLTVASLADDAWRALDEAGVGQANLMGISLGGMIAQQMYISRPERTASLILGCTMHGGRHAHPPPAHFHDLCAEWAHAPDPNGATAALEGFARMMLPAEALARPGGAKMLEQFVASFVQTPRTPEGLQSQLHAMSRFNSTQQLGDVACPTLVVTGDRDAVIPPANSESLAARIPGATLRRWDGAGHFWWSERPVEAVRMLSDFLLSADARSSAR